MKRAHLPARAGTCAPRASGSRQVSRIVRMTFDFITWRRPPAVRFPRCFEYRDRSAAIKTGDGGLHI